MKQFLISRLLLLLLQSFLSRNCNQSFSDIELKKNARNCQLKCLHLVVKQRSKQFFTLIFTQQRPSLKKKIRKQDLYFGYLISEHVCLFFFRKKTRPVHFYLILCVYFYRFKNMYFFQNFLRKKNRIVVRYLSILK